MNEPKERNIYARLFLTLSGWPRSWWNEKKKLSLCERIFRHKRSKWFIRMGIWLVGMDRWVRLDRQFVGAKPMHLLWYHGADCQLETFFLFLVFKLYENYGLKTEIKWYNFYSKFVKNYDWDVYLQIRAAGVAGIWGQINLFDCSMILI